MPDSELVIDQNAKATVVTVPIVIQASPTPVEVSLPPLNVTVNAQQGPPGEQGEQGEQGPPGEQGEQGEQGPPGFPERIGNIYTTNNNAPVVTTFHVTTPGQVVLGSWWNGVMNVNTTLEMRVAWTDENGTPQNYLIQGTVTALEATGYKLMPTFTFFSAVGTVVVTVTPTIGVGGSISFDTGAWLGFVG
jgi:hypothetical protein